jgi:hypothetical protein
VRSEGRRARRSVLVWPMRDVEGLREICMSTARRMADVAMRLRQAGKDTEADEATRLHDAFCRWAAVACDRMEATA